MSQAQPIPYWAHVHSVAPTLPEVPVRTAQGQIFAPAVYITSLDDPLKGQVGGAVCSADRETAARRIVERSHRLSTDEEIAQFYAAMNQRNHDCAEIETRKKLEKGGLITVLHPDAAQRYGVELGPFPPADVPHSGASEPARTGKGKG
jgi:hypothetical protein